MQRNGVGLTNATEGKSGSNPLSGSPKVGGEIKNKRVFIESTMDSILQSKTAKTSSYMHKPVGAMSGTGTTENPKVHSQSPRGTVGSSIVGLPNIVVGGSQGANVTKVNVRGGSQDTNVQPPAGPTAAES